MIREAIDAVVRRQDLSLEDSAQAMNEIMMGFLKIEHRLHPRQVLNIPHYSPISSLFVFPSVLIFQGRRLGIPQFVNQDLLVRPIIIHPSLGLYILRQGGYLFEDGPFDQENYRTVTDQQLRPLNSREDVANLMEKIVIYKFLLI